MKYNNQIITKMYLSVFAINPKIREREREQKEQRQNRQRNKDREKREKVYKEKETEKKSETIYRDNTETETVFSAGFCV